ncbi:MAG: hypothetical protein DRJ65_13775 [Acidobacteria bacterium]|nr:MAG: hypothetical protein DRJ65_13775 [Acidobacteriota bacterium]
MHRIVIFGNSGSGKSTLAREKAGLLACAHLDLDTVAWQEGHETPTRKSLTESRNQIKPFLAKNENWVIEGCYSDLLALAPRPEGNAQPPAHPSTLSVERWTFDRATLDLFDPFDLLDIRQWWVKANPTS